MSKPKAALAALSCLFLLAACGSRDGASAENNAQNDQAAAGTHSPESAGPADPAQPAAPAGGVADPAPPPDAVSHPDGYLPPAPEGGEPGNAASSPPDESPPATEDEYIRNRQSGR